MNILARLDVREPVLTDGDKLDLLEHVSSPALLSTSRALSLTSLCVHVHESHAIFGVAVPLADYLVDDTPMATQ